MYPNRKAGNKISETTVLSINEQIRPRLPEWLKVTADISANYFRIKEFLAFNKLHSVCQEASCPNIRECFGEGTATFLIMGPN